MSDAGDGLGGCCHSRFLAWWTSLEVGIVATLSQQRASVGASASIPLICTGYHVREGLSGTPSPTGLNARGQPWRTDCPAGREPGVDDLKGKAPWLSALGLRTPNTNRV